MKVSSKIYKGIEYVQLDELPADQIQRITESLSQESFIKILIGEKIIRNCIQYKDYEVWFDNIFRQAPIVMQKESMPQEHELTMVLDKA